MPSPSVPVCTVPLRFLGYFVPSKICPTHPESLNDVSLPRRYIVDSISFAALLRIATMTQARPLAVILISNMAAHAQIASRYRQHLLLTILPTREDILALWIWVRCKTQLNNRGCANFFECIKDFRVGNTECRPPAPSSKPWRQIEIIWTSKLTPSSPLG